MEQRIPWPGRCGNDPVLFQGQSSFLLAGVAGEAFPLCIEAPGGEVCQRIDPADIICVSAPGGGSLEAAMRLLALVREDHLPLLVLPRDHPGCRRLRYVVSAGPRIRLDAGILRGTHPEQDIICCHPEMAGLVLTGEEGHLSVTGIPPGVTLFLVRSGTRLSVLPLVPGGP